MHPAAENVANVELFAGKRRRITKTLDTRLQRVRRSWKLRTIIPWSDQLKHTAENSEPGPGEELWHLEQDLSPQRLFRQTRSWPRRWQDLKPKISRGGHDKVFRDRPCFDVSACFDLLAVSLRSSVTPKTSRRRPESSSNAFRAARMNLSGYGQRK